MSYILDSLKNLIYCQANVAAMILSLRDMLNGLRASQLINLGLMLFGTDNQREMEEGWDFTWLGTSVAVSENSVHSLIPKVSWYSGELVYIYKESGTTH